MGGDGARSGGKGGVPVVKRVAFTMKLKPGHVAEYKRRHETIWPELVAEIKRAGIADFSIFLDEATLTLFAVQKVGEDYDSVAHSSQEVSIRWREYMADILEVHSDKTAKCTPLKEVFHLD
jgi:L-rhamnose mutarotase